MAAKTPQDRRPKKATGESVPAQGGFKPVTVPICGHPVTVPPPGVWRQSANDALAEGRHNEWAVRVMNRDDAIIWFETDPTNDEVAEFFDAVFDDFASQGGPGKQAQLDAFRLRRRIR